MFNPAFNLLKPRRKKEGSKAVPIPKQAPPSPTLKENQSPSQNGQWFSKNRILNFFTPLEIVRNLKIRFLMGFRNKITQKFSRVSRGEGKKICLRSKKVYFFSGGIILVIFVLFILSLSRGLPQYLEVNPSSGLLGLLPLKPDFLVCLKSGKNQVFSLANLDLAKNLDLASWDFQFQKILDHFNLNSPVVFSLETKEVAWAQFTLGEEKQEILVLETRNPQKVSIYLQKEEDFRENSSSKATSIYQKAGREKSSYYTLIGNYLVFAGKEAFLKEIIDLPDQRYDSLESDPHFKKVWNKVDSRSPIFIYTTLRDWPAAITIKSPQDNILELEAYYLGNSDYREERNDPSWFRFIPPEAVGVVKGFSGSINTLFSSASGLDSLWSTILSSLDFQMFENNLGREYNLEWQANIKSLIQDDFEIIATPLADQTRALTLIVPGSKESEARLDKIKEALGLIATSQKSPREKQVTLPDGTVITEYIRDPSQDYIEEKYLEGIKVNFIDFPSQRQRFLYAYLGNKLVVSTAEEALQKVILSFRKPEDAQERIIPPEFGEGKEWFYFDLDWFRRGKNLFPGFQRMQGMSKVEGEGILVKLWFSP